MECQTHSIRQAVVLATTTLVVFCGCALLGQGTRPLAAPAAETQPVAPRALRSFDPSFLDLSTDPCQDFYKYACGGWTKANQVPPDQERVWISGQMNDRNFYLLYTELQQASASPKTPLQRQYGTFFQACMNSDQVNSLGARPLQPTMAAIAAMTQKSELAHFLADPRYLGKGLFTLSVEQDEKDSQKQLPTLRQAGLTLPTPDYYLADDPRRGATLLHFREYLETIFRLLGDQPQQARIEAKNVLDLETALAGSSMSRVEMRDPTRIYHPMTLPQLEQMAPAFAWRVYFAQVGAPAFASMNVEQPVYIETMAKLIATQSLSAWKSYLRIHAADPVAPFLSVPFAAASFEFFDATLRGQTSEQPRWKRCTVLSDKVLSDAVGQDWIRRNFPPESKAGAEQIIAGVRRALRKEIESLPWMSTEARQEALRKVDAMREKIGYPGHWRDDSMLRMDPAGFISDLHQADLLNQKEELSRIGKPVDEAIFYWTAPQADGNYNEHLNDIEFPAGILQPPRYSPSADAAINYGGLGTFVGHEMTHGLDDVGSRYDEQGNLRDWFTPSDTAAFDRMISCEVKEYSSFQAEPGLPLDGKLSVGENTADNGGLRIAFKALQEVMAREPVAESHRRLNGFTSEQRFFLGFAQTWCETRTEEFQRLRGQTDPHPPGEFRVNGSVQNFKEFGEAFGCRVGQPMMPANACRVW